jgi:hypothetical protein
MHELIPLVADAVTYAAACSSASTCVVLIIQEAARLCGLAIAVRGTTGEDRARAIKEYRATRHDDTPPSPL